MSILYDRTTGYWTLKIKDHDGKDKRQKIRKIQPGEPRRPVPDDVLAYAQTQIQTLNATQTPIQHLNATTLVSWCDRYLTRYARDRAPSSVVRMTAILSMFKRFAFGEGIATLDQIKTQTVEDYIDWRYQQVDPRLKIQVSRATVISEMRVLSGLFSAAVKAEMIVKNPIPPVVADHARLQPKTNQPKYLGPDELADFLVRLTAAERDGKIPTDYADIARVMLFSGLRLSASIHLTFDQINNDWFVAVPPSTGAVPTKTKTGYTAVICGPGREVIERRRQILGGKGRIFPNIRRADAVQWHMSKLGIYPHQLRHSFAVAAVDSGVPLQVIQSLLGHSSIATTAVYAKIRDKTKLAAAEQIKFG